MKLFYTQSANEWNEALPIGNGFLGGMVYGSVQRERIALNDDSLWSGGRKNRQNPDAKKYLPKVRELIFAGKIKDAEDLMKLALFSPNVHPAHYETLGDLFIDFGHNTPIANYTRGLDLETGTAWVQYDADGVTFRREYFISFPDDILCVRITASQPEALHFKVSYDRNRNLDDKYVLKNQFIVGTGRSLGEHGIRFASMFTVNTTGGKTEHIGAHAVVRSASEATILFTARTNYRNASYLHWCESILQNAVKKEYTALLKTHVQDYQSLSQRMTLHFGDDPNKETPTDIRLERVKEGAHDAGLIALYFQFGRYLLIASSREGSLPANLQGIWNDLMLPPWGGKYTININTQMNYWLAENCNLSDLHHPLFDHIEKMRIHGREVAHEMYGCRGFVAHHNTDAFGDTAPVDFWLPATIWQTSVAWLCTHIWEHYLFTQDLAFLKSKFETLKEACLFFVDFLIEDDKGRLVTNPSVSPENTYLLPGGESGVICYAPSMDSQIITELFKATIEATRLLGEDEAFAYELKNILIRLPQPEIGKHGQIMEWAEDYDEREPGHRHISHLYALYPAAQISPEATPELAVAARTTLERRLSHGGGHTGWSRAWIINFWARLRDGHKVYENIQALLAKSTLPNLLDNHPPFQIDGNFGGTAGILEMLLQSHQDLIHILPALPSQLPEGGVTHACARGGFDVSFAWKDGKLTKLEVLSKSGNDCTISFERNIKTFSTEAQQTYILI